jgi:hypothetical protein
MSFTNALLSACIFFSEIRNPNSEITAPPYDSDNPALSPPPSALCPLSSVLARGRKSGQGLMIRIGLRFLHKLQAVNACSSEGMVDLFQDHFQPRGGFSSGG